MKLSSLLGISLVFVEVKSYTSNRHETEALHRAVKDTESKSTST